MYVDGERLLDNQDLCQLLQTSKQSLQRYRSSGMLRYRKLRHKTYYTESDVQEFLKNIWSRSRQVATPPIRSADDATSYQPDATSCQARRKRYRRLIPQLISQSCIVHAYKSIMYGTEKEKTKMF